jgi:O-antigen ligase
MRSPGVVDRRAALQITKTNPLFGTGPGTFAIPYAQLKRPESEMSRLVHNDYLEQACDSGLPGFSAYLVLVAGVLFLTGKPLFIGSSAVKAANQTSNPAQKRSARAEIAKSYPMGATQVDWQRFAVWLGLVGWSTQGLFEFGLYIPALAWVAFSFMGWLLGTPRQDMRAVSRS